MERVNVGHQVAYGDDDVTAELSELIREHFGPTAEVFPVFNGTGANVVAMQSMAKPWEVVICAASAHVNVDEGGAPEQVAGLKLWQVPTADGKLTPELINTQAWGFGDVHRAQPGVMALTQSTELGTRYSIDELAAAVGALSRTACGCWSTARAWPMRPPGSASDSPPSPPTWAWMRSPSAAPRTGPWGGGGGGAQP